MDEQIEKTEVSAIIDNFRGYLNGSYDFVREAYALRESNACCSSFDEYFSDWVQASWELIVERCICGVKECIPFYGDGADYGEAYSRVFFRDWTPTHELVCIAKSEAVDLIEGQVIELEHYQFECFVTRDEGWFKVAPPFDCVLLSKRNTTDSSSTNAVVNLNQVGWKVVEI